ncbi:MAG: hypothetical protein OXQ89_19130 [Rhodospirillaceae bacterium]|nr:hypothetical protein [Rhodospirillaceae bacterium]MDD9999859.1 hypothetical protein [Rhodospirillaceae bacterium]
MNEFASVLAEYGPGTPDHNPQRWAEIQQIAGYFGMALESDAGVLLDPLEGPQH